MDTYNQLFEQYKTVKFQIRASSGAERKEFRTVERKLSTAMSEAFRAITDSATVNELYKAKADFEAAFSFTPEATCEAELDFNF